MQRIKDLDYYQKGVLLVMVIMTLFFAVLYLKTISKVGFEYNDAILVPTQEGENMMYSGKIKGEPACFTVSKDKTVVFQHGDKTYGPYTVKEDPTAIPKDKGYKESMTGVEIRNGEEILFRGGILDVGYTYWMYNEDGEPDNLKITYMTGDGLERDENGNVIDKMEPSALTVYKLVNNPPLTHNGESFGWFAGAFICVLNALFVLFADELFRWNLMFRVRNVEEVEPSDWEIAGRYIGWTVMTIIAFVIYIKGLTS